jgi:hypothetical protein
MHALLFLLGALAVAQQNVLLARKNLALGGGTGSFPMADGRTLDAQDLYIDRGMENNFNKYWLNAIPAGGGEWQPSWFSGPLATEKGKSNPVFIVFYIVHEV